MEMALLFLLSLSVGLVLILRERALSRRPNDVLADLFETDQKAPSDERLSRARKPCVKQTSAVALVVAVLCVMLTYAVLGFSLPKLLVAGAAGFISSSAAATLITRRAARIKAKQIDFFLSIVMERLVMAVEAGLDVFPAIGAVVELESRHRIKLDPVTALLAQVKAYAENGMTLDGALRAVSQSSDSAPLRHAFLHLAVAQREGGELIMPLRELSDATQLHYQEAIEESIAKMPVKATMPLMCTFAGLIILFLTTPVIQVIKVTERSTIASEDR